MAPHGGVSRLFSVSYLLEELGQTKAGRKGVSAPQSFVARDWRDMCEKTVKY